MRVLVTGANGFLGRAVVEAFRQNGDEVLATGKKTDSDLPNYISADISEGATKLEDLKNIETVIHAAGLAHRFQETSKNDFWRVNVGGTKNIARLAQKLKAKNFVLISSVAVYGRANFADLEFEEDAICKPSGAYAESKFESEKAAVEILQGSGINLAILRPTTIVGENDPGNVGRLIRMIDKGKFFWLGKGKNLKSLVYKADVAAACLAVLANKSREDPQIYNVTAAALAMRKIVGEIEKVLEKKVPKIFVPSTPMLFGAGLGAKSGLKKIVKIHETIEKWLSEDVFSGRKIKSKINFVAQTDPLDGLRREVLYYKTEC